jgi:DNA invertase Pin-like site-specific DNA recombinase
MAKIGYARVSSKEQNLDRQLKALEGVSKVFSDKLSGQSVERPQLQAMLNYIREGDIVVVTELDRLGRNNKELTELMNQIQIKGATLEVLNLPSMNGIEDENLRRLINNLVIELYKYQAESERKRIKRERQAQGIEIAKKKGKFKGRQPKFKKNDPRLQHAFDLFLNGLSDKEVEEQTGINRRTFRRYRSRYNVTVDQRKNNEKRDS